MTQDQHDALAMGNVSSSTAVAPASTQLATSVAPPLCGIPPEDNTGILSKEMDGSNTFAKSREFDKGSHGSGTASSGQAGISDIRFDINHQKKGALCKQDDAARWMNLSETTDTSTDLTPGVGHQQNAFGVANQIFLPPADETTSLVREPLSSTTSTSQNPLANKSCPGARWLKHMESVVARGSSTVQRDLWDVIASDSDDDSGGDGKVKIGEDSTPRKDAIIDTPPLATHFRDSGQTHDPVPSVNAADDTIGSSSSMTMGDGHVECSSSGANNHM